MKVENLDKEIIFNNDDIDLKTQVVSNNIAYYHSHSFYEIFYIITGETNHFLNGKIDLLSFGDLVLLKPGDVHCFLENKKLYTHRDIIVSSCLWNKITDLLHIDLFSFFNFKEKITLKLEQINDLEKLIAKFENFSKKLTPEKNPYSYLLVSEILKLFLSNFEQPNSETTPKWITTLTNKLSLPENIFKEKEEILSDFHYSYNHICREFKSYTGQTLTEFINNKRLEYVAIILSTTNETIENICNNCGYKSMPYFIKIFKNKYKILPSQFRHK